MLWYPYSLASASCPPQLPTTLWYKISLQQKGQVKDSELSHFVPYSEIKTLHLPWRALGCTSVDLPAVFALKREKKSTGFSPVAYYEAHA